MVCNRCIMVVRSIFQKNGIDPASVELGEVLIQSTIPFHQLVSINSELTQVGFEIIDEEKTILIEKIKNLIVELIHYSDDELKMNLSDYLAKKTHYDYNYLSNLFSEIESTTIEKYFIAQRVEKVKELLVYHELTLAEIADRLNYSSVAYLSGQFKKITGLTPSYYKLLKENKRRKIEEI